MSGGANLKRPGKGGNQTNQTDRFKGGIVTMLVSLGLIPKVTWNFYNFEFYEGRIKRYSISEKIFGKYSKLFFR